MIQRVPNPNVPSDLRAACEQLERNVLNLMGRLESAALSANGVVRWRTVAAQSVTGERDASLRRFCETIALQLRDVESVGEQLADLGVIDQFTLSPIRVPPNPRGDAEVRRFFEGLSANFDTLAVVLASFPDRPPSDLQPSEWPPEFEFGEGSKGR